jgi:hypothetical protein
VHHSIVVYEKMIVLNGRVFEFRALKGFSNLDLSKSVLCLLVVDVLLLLADELKNFWTHWEAPIRFLAQLLVKTAICFLLFYLLKHRLNNGESGHRFFLICTISVILDSWESFFIQLPSWTEICLLNF